MSALQKYSAYSAVGAIIGATGEQITGEQIVCNIVSKLNLKYLLGYRRYKKLVLFWRNRTRLANLPTPEQIIRTYLGCHLTYHSACVNTGLPPFRYIALRRKKLFMKLCVFFAVNVMYNALGALVFMFFEGQHYK